MPFTDKGYETRRFPEILEELRSNLEQDLGTPISSDPNSIIGIINSIISNQISIQENNVQALSNNLDIHKAEGVYLDRLVRYIGLSRLAETPASGLLKVTRDSTTPITGSVLFSTSTGVTFVSPNIATPLSACSSLKLAPISVVAGISYTITVNGTSFTKVSTLGDTGTTIAFYFSNEISNVLGLDVTHSGSVITFNTPDQEINSLNFSFLDNFNVIEISAYNEVESVNTGFLEVSQGTINTVVSTQPSILSVNNPLDFVSGSALESDEELRARYEISLANGGNTTYDNILASLLQLPNVTDAFIIENPTQFDDVVTGLPPNSYECVVVDGSASDIAEEVWKTKPAGVQTYGQLTSLVQDITGGTHEVKWSRPEFVYMFVRITYSLYDEESFPSTGDEDIRTAVLSYGETYTLNEDVIPTRFIGDIYRNVEGIDNIKVDIGYTLDPLDTSPVGGYQTTRLPISSTQIAVFTKSKVSVVRI